MKYKKIVDFGKFGLIEFGFQFHFVFQRVETQKAHILKQIFML